jgi:hypothetical protein
MCAWVFEKRMAKEGQGAVRIPDQAHSLIERLWPVTLIVFWLFFKTRF